jgi:hypothetical protein
MKGNFDAMRHNLSDSKSLMQKLEHYVDRETRGILWEHHTDFAADLRE